MDSFNWLHLSDLHWGEKGQTHYWPNIRDNFFDDLTELQGKCGPWHAVLFTGDLTYSGTKPEFIQLEECVLGPLFDYFAKMGYKPALLTVPGNHDLVWPQGKKNRSAAQYLSHPDHFYEIADDFWDDKYCEYRKVIEEVFSGYSAWWSKRAHAASQLIINDGLLPGEFSTTFVLPDGYQIGVLGLNTAFLQLKKADYKNKLAWDVRQFNGACPNEDGSFWVKDHDVCLLMTHHGPEWLNKKSREEVYPEINPAGRFAVHLFGHMHNEAIRTTMEGGGFPLRNWQGASLFSKVKYGKGKQKRHHGYSAGRLRFEEGAVNLQLWPRKAVFDTNGWRFVPDHESCRLDKNGGTFSEFIKLRPRTIQTKHPPMSSPLSEKTFTNIRPVTTYPDEADLNCYISRPDKEREILNYFDKYQPHYQRSRLVTIHASGGMGKTRLARECSRQAASMFQDGTLFVELDRVEGVMPSIKMVAEAIGTKLGMPVEASLPEMVLANLRGREMLLVLDNYESVACDEVADYLSDLLEQARNVSLLVTGRQPVRLDSIEQRVDLDSGMEVGQARELFIARARLKKGNNWSPSPREEPHLARIIEQNERLPLAIEFAAAWVNHRTLKMIADEIEEKRIYAPPSGFFARNQRHRTLWSCQDWSFGLLEDWAKQGFIRLAVFHADFASEAVESVCELSDCEKLLSHLQNAALLRRIENCDSNRYRMHRFTRDYALEKLQSDPFMFNHFHQRFVEYFVNEIEKKEVLLAQSISNPEDVRIALDWIETEWPNVYTCLESVLKNKNWQAVRRICDVLLQFSLKRGHFQDIESLCQKYYSVPISLSKGEQRIGKGMILNTLGVICQFQGRWEEAKDAFIGSLELRQDIERAKTLNSLGMVYQDQPTPDWNEALRYHEESLRICRELYEKEARREEATTLGNLGLVYEFLGRSSEGDEALKKAYEIWRDFDDDVGLAGIYNNFGRVYQNRRKWKDAQYWYWQRLSMLEKINDEVGIARTLNSLGTVYINEAEDVISKNGKIESYRQAKNFFQKALEKCKLVGDTVEEGATYSNLGKLYKAKKNLKYAAEKFLQSSQLLSGIKKAQALNSRGSILQSQKKWQDAEDCYRQALEIVKGRDEIERTVCLENLGRLYVDQQRFLDAEQCFKQICSMRKGLDQAKTLNALGWIYKCRAKGLVAKECEEMRKQALECYEKAYQLSEQAGDHDEMNRSIDNILHLCN